MRSLRGFWESHGRRIREKLRERFDRKVRQRLSVGATFAVVMLSYQNCANDFNTVNLDAMMSSKQLCTLDNSRLETEARNVMTNACASCHAVGATSTDSMNRFFSVFDPELMVKNGDIVPGSAESSLVYLKIVEGNHPSSGAPSAVEVRAIRSWLDNGFKACEAPVTDHVTTVRYPEIQEMLRTHGCFGCHDQPMSAFGNVGFGAYAEGLKTVDPASPENSRLLLNLDRMVQTYPGTATPFTSDEKAKLHDWIRGGAPE